MRVFLVFIFMMSPVALQAVETRIDSRFLLPVVTSDAIYAHVEAGLQYLPARDHKGVALQIHNGLITASFEDRYKGRKIKSSIDNLVRSFLFSKDYLVNELGLMPDYRRIAGKYSESKAVKNLYSGLTEGLVEKTDIVLAVLGYVQAIPYQEFPGNGIDSDILLPDGVIEYQVGDCDSKWVLFAAMMKIAGIDVILGIKPGHVVAGVCLDSEGCVNPVFTEVVSGSGFWLGDQDFVKYY